MPLLTWRDIAFSRGQRGWTRDVAFLAIFLAWSWSSSAASAASAATPETAREYDLKAAFIYNFTLFVEWPDQAFKAKHEPIRICILGENPFGHGLEKALAGKVADDRTFEVAQVPDVKQTVRCRVLFVSNSEQKRIPAIVEALRSACGVLTVGDMDGFAAQGGVMNFKLEGGRVRFEINTSAALQQHLRISAKLLSLATLVRK